MADQEPFAGMAQENTLQRLANVLNQLADILNSPAGFDPAQQRQRVTAAIESGATIGVVTTLSNMSQIDGRNAATIVQAMDDCAWNEMVRSKIS